MSVRLSGLNYSRGFEPPDIISRMAAYRRGLYASHYSVQGYARSGVWGGMHRFWDLLCLMVHRPIDDFMSYDVDCSR